MPMPIYAAKSSPSGMATDSCDMYLVAAAKNGDHQAYAELCRRHSRQIFQTVLRITGNISDAEDALQEALLKAYVHIGGFEGRSAFSSWLTRIAINSALMLLRKKRSQPVCSFESDPEIDDFNLPEPVETSRSPEESCMQNALENELAQAIRYLPPHLRVVRVFSGTAESRPRLDLYMQEDGEETRAAQGQFLAALGMSTTRVR